MAMTLSNVRDAMAARNIATLRGNRDQVAAARAIVGRTNSTEPYLSKMIRALSLLTCENTAEDWQRLEAAIIVRAYKRQ